MNTKKAIAIVLLIIATVLVLTGCALSNKLMRPSGTGWGVGFLA